MLIYALPRLHYYVAMPLLLIRARLQRHYAIRCYGRCCSYAIVAAALRAAPDSYSDVELRQLLRHFHVLMMLTPC